jgi:ABC-2 type transport system permease protein
MSGNSAFELVQEQGWRRGLGNLLRGELQGWFGTRTWLIQILMWVGIIDGILVSVLLATRQESGGSPSPAALAEMLTLYTIFAGMFAAVGVIIIMQSVIVGEKNSGTAAWVLSKPVSRAAFVTAKLAANTIAVLVLVLLIPGLVSYLLLSTLASETWLPLGSFVSGLAIIGLNQMFYLTLMLGTLSDSLAAVIGVPIALLFGQQFFIGMLPFLVNLLPHRLAVPVSEQIPSIAATVIQGKQPDTYLPVISALILCVIFTAVAYWRFEGEEF